MLADFHLLSDQKQVSFLVSVLKHAYELGSDFVVFAFLIFDHFGAINQVLGLHVVQR